MKLIGSIFIILASIFSSYYYENKLKCNINKIESLIDLVKYIKTRIEYYSMTLEEILRKYGNKNPWKDALLNSTLIGVNNLNENTKNDILSFISAIGKGYKKEQLSLCEYTINSLNNELEKMKAEFTKKSKIYRSLSIFFGVGLVILIV